MSEKDALLILNAIPYLSNKQIVKLFDYYGSAKNVLRQSNDLAASKLLPSKACEEVAKFDHDRFLEEEYKSIKEAGIDIIAIHDEVYPARLKEIDDAPVILYVKGALPETLDIGIAIVGSRASSLYGLSTAEKFAYELGRYDIPVISGLAKGIDAAAHRGALKAKGSTMAVLGCGLAEVYPKENAQLFIEIPQSGAVISEFPMRMQPMTYNFPRRNRIVSGLSQGVVVVEAAKRSGALITADLALEQGREVYAVPGKIDSPTAGGTNDLIRQGAKIVTAVDDVLEDIAVRVNMFGTQRTDNQNDQNCENILKNLTAEEKIVYNQITGDPVEIDLILRRCVEENVLSAQAVLLKLEMKHLIKQLPGKRFLRNFN